MACGPCGKEYEIGTTLAEMELHRAGKKKIMCPTCKRRPLKQELTPIRFRIK